MGTKFQLTSPEQERFVSSVSLRGGWGRVAIALPVSFLDDPETETWIMAHRSLVVGAPIGGRVPGQGVLENVLYEAV